MNQNSNESLTQQFVFDFLTLSCWLRDSWELLPLRESIREGGERNGSFESIISHLVTRVGLQMRGLVYLCFHRVNQGAIVVIFTNTC